MFVVRSMPRIARSTPRFTQCRGRLMSSLPIQEEYEDEICDLSAEHRLSRLRKTPKDLMGCQYLYDEWGSSNYDDACQDSYYLYAAEEDLLKSNASDIAKYFLTNRSWIDIGCGTGQKIIPILQGCKEAVTYYPVNISNDFLSIVQTNITNHAEHVEVKPVAASYNEPETFLTLQRITNTPRVWSIFGGELMCMERENHDTLLRRIHQTMNTDDILLIGYDPKKHPKIHVDSYDYEMSHLWFKNIVTNLGVFLGHDFNLKDFDYVPLFEESTNQLRPYSSGVVHYLRCKREQHIATKFGERIHMAEGEMMYLLHSAKPTPEELELSMMKYGFFKTRGFFSCSDNLMGVDVYKKF